VSLDPRYFEVCKYCGEHIQFIPNDAVSAGAKTGWTVLNVTDWQPHVLSCKKKAPKVYTDEEKAEFMRKRKAGEV
jgi:hypothetical protein